MEIGRGWEAESSAKGMLKEEEIQALDYRGVGRAIRGARER